MYDIFSQGDIDMKKHAGLAFAAASITASGLIPALPAHASTSTGEDITIYVDAKSSAARNTSGNDGATRSTAVTSVAQAQKIAQEKKASNVTIHLAPGVYPPIEWSYAPEGGKVTMTGENPVSRTADASTMASFTCNGGDGYAITVKSDVSYSLSNADISRCNDGGILATGASSITLYQNYYHHIGGNWADGTGYGFAAVHLKNVDDAKVLSSDFYALNSSTNSANIHGVYAANDSDRVNIYDNNFGFISGDPIRFRNGSDYGTVDSNRFWSTGYIAIASDWRFGSEKCSVGNVLWNNRVGKWTFDGHEYNVDERVANGITPSYRKWGHDDAEAENLGGCSPAPIEFGGGSSWVGTDPRT